MAGPMMDAACLTYEGIGLELEVFPRTKDDIWILGKNYNTEKDASHTGELNTDIRSRLWFTYRKNFPPIGGTGPTSDNGWGCMLRCGQMMFAQALICRHLGREWQWSTESNSPTYTQILQAFLDKKDSLYSIHQIAQMGVSEGKSVGSWFGPNTVAQVLKKLTVFDDWSSMCVHVAMDNTIIVEDVKILCKRDLPVKSGGQVTCNNSTASQGSSRRQQAPASPTASKASPTQARSSWRPLLLFIPLRLGLTEMNSVYSETLKVCFTFKQSLGVIGGKPNHAHYFIGYYGNNLIYLDPHTSQLALNVDNPSMIPDESYHCVYPSRMNISDLDPSVALGFFCGSEAEFDDLCEQFDKHIVLGQRRPMFEVADVRPPHWPRLEIPKRPSEDLNLSCQSDFTELDFDSEDGRGYDTEGEYEIL